MRFVGYGYCTALVPRASGSEIWVRPDFTVSDGSLNSHSVQANLALSGTRHQASEGSHHAASVIESELSLVVFKVCTVGNVQYGVP